MPFLAILSVSFHLFVNFLWNSFAVVKLYNSADLGRMATAAQRPRWMSTHNTQAYTM